MNKKRIFSIISVFIIVIGLVILYIKTDLFKTKEQLFWKYLLIEKDEIASVISDKDMERYSNELKKSTYIKEGNILIESENKLINPVNIKISEKGNKQIDCKNISIDLNYNDKNIGSTNIIKDDNYYFVKNELLGSKYIGIENAGLRQIANDFGLNNTDFIPDKIRDIDWVDFFYINDSDLRYILKKYIPICRKYVKNKDYIKKENVKSDNYMKDLTVYELELSERQIKNVITDVLDNIYNDDRTLKIITKKISIIDDESKYCNVDKLKEKIKEISNYFHNKDVNNEKFLSIIIYKKENNVVKTEIVLKNDRTLSIEKKNENEIVLKQYNVENLKIDLNSLSGIAETILNYISEVTYNKRMEDDKTINVKLNIICNFGVENITFKYNYVEQINNNIEKILRKSDIEFIDLKKYNKEMLESTLQKALKFDSFQPGRNYYKIF